MNTVVKQSKDYELIAASWHEAAHTVCGLFNFIKVYQVYVSSDKYNHGQTLYEMHDREDVNDKLLAKILSIYEVQTLYAGLVGEKMYYKEICGSDKFPMHLRIGSSDDIKEAARIINKYNLSVPGPNRFVFKKQIQNDTRTILTNYWSDVKLIAHILYKHKELNYDELKYFLTRRSQNSEFWKARFKDIKLIDSDKESEERLLKDVLLQNSIIIM